MTPSAWTFQKILPACEKGQHEAWKAFLDAYSAVAFACFGFYLPSLRDRQKEIWREVLQALTANDCERLRTFDHQAEREFLVDLRNFLLEAGAPRLDRAQDLAGPPRPSLDSVSALLQGLPFLHRQAVILKLAGYSDRALERMLKIPPAAAARAVQRLEADYSAFLTREEDECLWPAPWLEFLRSVRAAASQDCVPLRQFVRIFDGQASWYDKAPVEEHVTGCLHCLERWTSLHEVKHWRAKAKPLAPGEMEEFLSVLPIRSAAPARKSLLGRLFG